MRNLKILLPAVLIAGCASTSTAPSSATRFNQADKNNDGSVSRQEATDIIIAEAFEMYDTDDDGFVDEAEFVASGGTAENFKKINQSGSGKVSLEEAKSSPLVFNTFVVSFDEADANKDGSVSYSEYQAYLQLRDAAVR